MRILHVISGLAGGGAQKLVVDIMLALREQKNITADILLLDDKNNVFDDALKSNGISITVSPYRNAKNPMNLFFLKDYIKNGKYDVVHAHLFPTIYWISFAAMLTFKNRPLFVMTEHSTHNLRREKSYIKYLEKLIYSQYDKIISISQKTQENLISWLTPKKSKINSKFFVVENGVNLEKYKNAIPYEKKEIYSGYLNTDKLLVMVGRFSIQKDQPTLIRAMKELPENIKLLFVGDGELKQENIQLAKELRVSNRIHFLGFRKDVERIVKTADIVILSSNWEGFGLAAVEGMAACKPVLASDVPGLKEVVNGAGVTFEKGNSSDVSAAIKSLLKDNEEYVKVSDKCAKRANDFSIDKMINKYKEIYKSN